MATSKNRIRMEIPALHLGLCIQRLLPLRQSNPLVTDYIQPCQFAGRKDAEVGLLRKGWAPEKAIIWLIALV